MKSTAIQSKVLSFAVVLSLAIPVASIAQSAGGGGQLSDSDLDEVVGPHEAAPGPMEPTSINAGPYANVFLKPVLHYTNQPYNAPVQFPFAHYDTGGLGFGYHDTTVGNAGGYLRQEDVDIYFRSGMTVPHFVGRFATGEWLRFSMDPYSSSWVSADPELYELFGYIRYSAPSAANNRQLGFSVTEIGQARPTIPQTTHTFPATSSATGEFQYRRVRLKGSRTQRQWFGNISESPRFDLWISAQLGGGIDLNSMRWRFDIDPAPTSPTGRRPIVAEDHFVGTAGSALNGRQSCSSSYCRWVASSGLHIGADAQVVSSNTGVVVATQTWPNASDPGAQFSNAYRRVSAQLKLGGANWLAVGFAGSPGGNLLTNGEVYAQIRPNGTYRIVAKGQTHDLTGGERLIPAEAQFDVNGFNLVELTASVQEDPYVPGGEFTCDGELWINGIRAYRWQLPNCIPDIPTERVSVNYPAFAGRAMVYNQSKVDGFIVDSGYLRD